MNSFDIIIVGGGLNGPVLALAAAQAGFRCALIDPLPLAGDGALDGRSYALSKGSQRVLNAVGLWPLLADAAQPMQQIKVSDARLGERPAPQVLFFQGDEIEDSPMGFMVEDTALRRAFARLLPQTPKVTVITGRAVAQCTDGAPAQVTLEDGRVLSGALIVGCDGRNSAVAARAGLTRAGWSYGQTALVCTLGVERPHNGIAHQMFLPGGPLAILPLTGQRVSIVWSEQTQRAQALASASDAGFMEALRQVFGQFLGQIELQGPRFAYPLSLSVAHDFARPRLCLVGDAAHGMHPVAGQGLNAGVRDIAALIDVLSEARARGEDIGTDAVLHRYTSWRRLEVMALLTATDIITRSFSNDNALLRPLRDMALGAINALPPLRRDLVRRAAGLDGRLPRLMRP